MTLDGNYASLRNKPFFQNYMLTSLSSRFFFFLIFFPLGKKFKQQNISDKSKAWRKRNHIFPIFKKIPKPELFKLQEVFECLPSLWKIQQVFWNPNQNTRIFKFPSNWYCMWIIRNIYLDIQQSRFHVLNQGANFCATLGVYQNKCHLLILF